MSDTIPQAVLTERLEEAIAGRRVRAAVFTTFSFDPGFFEMEVLPALFTAPFSQVEGVRLAQLEDELRSVDEVAVYYDRRALAADAEPARLDVRRIDVSRASGFFHPKVTLILVEDPDDDDIDGESSLALIVSLSSANLTRSGYWENVEGAHFEEIKDRVRSDERWNWRKDLIRLIRSIRRCAVDGEGHDALDAVREFVVRRTSKQEYTRNRDRGRFHTRIFCGQSTLPSWLGELRVRRDWNLEILSPFFDRSGAGTLEAMLDVLRPRQTRIYLPLTADGSALVSRRYHQAVTDLGVHWSKVRGSLLNASGGVDAPPRRVHAKLYRLWSRDEGEVVVVGSVNLTRAGHSSSRGGNVEAAYLLDRSGQRGRREWWLDPIDHTPETYVDEMSGEHDDNEASLELTLRFDWSSGTFDYLLLEDVDGPIVVEEIAGSGIGEISRPINGEWTPLGDETAASMRDLLLSTSLVQVSWEGGRRRVLVREESMAFRPSLLKQLTPEEILLYWSLLTPEQRAAFLEEKLLADGALEGLSVRRGERYTTQDTLFDRFAGLFHAFGRLENSIRVALAEDRPREADARLLGAKHDSLPVLLEKVRDRDDGDPIMTWLTFLSARQVLDQLIMKEPSYIEDRRDEVDRLEDLLDSTHHLRERIEIPAGRDREDFLDWYEESFLMRAVTMGEGS